VKYEPGYLDQRWRVSIAITAKRQHHRVVNGFFAGTADSGICQPKQRMPPVNDLERCLDTVYPHIAAPEMDHFGQQDRAHLAGGKLLN
jgi:hypothetical protein